MIHDIDRAIYQLEVYAPPGASAARLRELYSTMEFTDLCVTRFSLSQMDLTDEQAGRLKAVDERMSAAFTPNVLELYADYFPSYPIRAWWRAAMTRDGYVADLNDLIDEHAENMPREVAFAIWGYITGFAHVGAITIEDALLLWKRLPITDKDLDNYDLTL